jgi:hypothetical protein
LTGEFIRQDEEGEWICLKREEVLKKAGVLMIEEYIQRRRETIMKYAQTRDMCGKCKSSQKIASNLLWWEVNYYSNDAAEALTSQARPTVNPPCMPPASTHSSQAPGRHACKHAGTHWLFVNRYRCQCIAKCCLQTAVCFAD